MIYERNRTVFKPSLFFRIFHFIYNEIILHISFLSVAFKGWQFATRAYFDEKKRYRRSQQWKIFFRCLINSKFANEWFKILQSKEYSIIATHRNRLYHKPFRGYMSIKWTKDRKKKVILDTYQFIMSKGEAFMSVVTNTCGMEIANFKLNDTTEGHLNLRCGNMYNREGELVVSFSCDRIDGIIASAVFSFEKMEDGRWVCRIGCVQSYNRDGEGLKVAQKLLHGFRPKSFMVFIVQEFSRQLGCSALYGAGDSIHSYRAIHAIYLPWRHKIQFDYDTFWSEAGGRLTDDGWYELPLIPIRKENSQIKTNKRSLYLKRYCLFDNISLEISRIVKVLSLNSLAINKTINEGKTNASI